MRRLQKMLAGYQKIGPHLRNLFVAQFFIQSVNTAFFLLLNFYMVEEGFADYQVAEVLSYRFLAVCLLAFPLGLFIKGRKLRPFFYTAAIGLPFFSLLIIYAIEVHEIWLLNGAAMVWGVAYTCMQITVLPFILLNSDKEVHSEAFSLSYLSFSVTMFLVGTSYYVLNSWAPDFIDEKRMLQLISGLSFLSIFFVSRIRWKERTSEKIPLRSIISNYDWGDIFKAVTPTLIIAIGAGFTIPVINLFFLNVHGVSSDQFSIIGAACFLLVACVMIFIPFIRRSFGYRTAITLFQSLAVLALFLLATTEYYADWEFAVYFAIFFYVIRQPLMNAAQPMTTELSMYYVGKKNQEIISALNASIWSGSWFISTQIFSLLRQMNLRYVTIFLITVLFYTVGVIWYAFLIRAYERQTGKNGKAVVAKLSVNKVAKNKQANKMAKQRFR